MSVCRWLGLREGYGVKECLWEWTVIFLSAFFEGILLIPTWSEISGNLKKQFLACESVDMSGTQEIDTDRELHSKRVFDLTKYTYLLADSLFIEESE